MWIDRPRSLCHCQCSQQRADNCLIWFGAENTHSHVYTRTHSPKLTGCSRCTCTSAYKIDRLFYLARLQVRALSASHTGSLREMCVIYQGERMTARALIVNHWQHYWTSPPSPIWICVGKLGEPVINQSITHRNVCTQTSTKHGSTNPPPHIPHTDTCTHTHTNTSEMIINVLITSLWQELSFFFTNWTKVKAKLK